MVHALWLLMLPTLGFAQMNDYVPSIENGNRLYQEHCLVCHGAHGEAQTAMAGMLSTAPTSFVDPKVQESMTPASAFKAITQGRKQQGMPSYAKLSKVQRWDVAAYIFTFEKQVSPTESPRPELLWFDSRDMTDLQIKELFRRRGVPAEEVISKLGVIRTYPQ